MSTQLFTGHERLAIVMVGLPGTGKTFTARNLCRYLRWMGVSTRTISVAAYRHRILTVNSSHNNGTMVAAAYFDPENKDALRKRMEISEAALRDLIAWLTAHKGVVGILDASNTIPERRQKIEDELSKAGIKCVFLECLYDDGHFDVSRHVDELRLTCPEYAGVPRDAAVLDYNQRIAYYRLHYRTLEDCKPSKAGYIQSMNGGERFIIERVNGFLCSRMIYYLMNLRQQHPRSIYLHIQDDCLGSKNLQLAVDCACFFHQTTGRQVQVWTFKDTNSPVRSLIEGSSAVQVIDKPRLRELEIGNLNTPNPRTDTDPNTATHRVDQYYWRNPEGESYHDLAIRLEPVIMELEGMSPCHDVLISADITVLRSLYGYFCELDKQSIVTWAPDDMVDIVELKPKAYGCYEMAYTSVLCSGHDAESGDLDTRLMAMYGGGYQFRPYKDNHIGSPAI